MKHHRLYFDATPNAHVRAGKYEDVPLQQLPEWQDPNGHAGRMRKRFKQFPSQALDMRRRRWKPKAPPMLSTLLPGFTTELKSSHSYSFPSWSEHARRGAQSSRSPDAHTVASLADSSDTGEMESLGVEFGKSSPSGRGTHGSHNVRRSSLKRLPAGLAPEKEAQVILFQDWCESKYGQMITLWRKLDKDGNMTLSKAEFLKGLKELNFPGKPSLLWSILDSDTTGLITITEFVPVAALQLAKFKHWADERFGSVQKAFHHFDSDRNGKMTMQEFIRGCNGQDFPADLKGSIQALFDVMDDSRSMGKALITAEEISFLDAWKCPDYLWARPDDAAKKAFLDALMERHGMNYIIAWRKCLDKDSTMRVNFPEFTRTCKLLAKHGLKEAMPASGIPALFCAFDSCRRGWFTLRDWHEQSWNLLAIFRRWAHSEFFKVSECFRAWEANTAGIKLGNFRSHIKELNMTSEEKEYLFEGLSLEAEVWSDEKGRYAHGTLTRAEIVFLDTWDPDEELREARAWDEQFRSPTPSDTVLQPLPGL